MIPKKGMVSVATCMLAYLTTILCNVAFYSLTGHLSLAAINFGAFGIIQWLIVAIIVAGCIGIALVAARQAGIVIPSFAKTIVWIVICCVVAIVAIKFLASML